MVSIQHSVMNILLVLNSRSKCFWVSTPSYLLYFELTRAYQASQRLGCVTPAPFEFVAQIECEARLTYRFVIMVAFEMEICSGVQHVPVPIAVETVPILVPTPCRLVVDLIVPFVTQFAFYFLAYAPVDE